MSHCVCVMEEGLTAPSAKSRLAVSWSMAAMAAKIGPIPLPTSLERRRKEKCEGVHLPLCQPSLETPRHHRVLCADGRVLIQDGTGCTAPANRSEDRDLYIARHRQVRCQSTTGRGDRQSIPSCFARPTHAPSHTAPTTPAFPARFAAVSYLVPTHCLFCGRPKPPPAAAANGLSASPSANPPRQDHVRLLTDDPRCPTDSAYALCPSTRVATPSRADMNRPVAVPL